ncbi:UNVERIFIED_CONTAM: hypothetical protein FKN15_042811 [Acipenser sinensis]
MPPVGCHRSVEISYYFHYYSIIRLGSNPFTSKKSSVSDLRGHCDRLVQLKITAGQLSESRNQEKLDISMCPSVYWRQLTSRAMGLEN